MASALLKKVNELAGGYRRGSSSVDAIDIDRLDTDCSSSTDHGNSSGPSTSPRNGKRPVTDISSPAAAAPATAPAHGPGSGRGKKKKVLTYEELQKERDELHSENLDLHRELEELKTPIRAYKAAATK